MKSIKCYFFSKVNYSGVFLNENHFMHAILSRGFLSYYIRGEYNMKKKLALFLIALYIFSLFAVFAAFKAIERAVLTQEQYKEFTIRLKSREFLPEQGIQDETFSELDAMIKEGKTPHVMIQLEDIPSRMEQESLKANGVELVSYIGGNAWFASVSNKDALLFGVPEVAAENPSLASIRWIGKISPEDKIAPVVIEKGIGDWARTADGKVELVISY